MDGSATSKRVTAPKAVLIFSAGGLEHGGGIGRMIGYMLDAWPRGCRRPKPKVVDTRGPPRRVLALVIFARSILQLVQAGLTTRPLIYIHIAGRGSTLRKAILTAVARVFRLRIVLHLHDFDYKAFLSTLPASALGLIGWVFRSASAVVVLGQADRQTVTQVLGVSPSAVVVVANCVPAPTIEAPVRPPGGPVQFLFLGDPSRRKGVHDLLAAFSHPSLSGEGVPPWRAVIAGGGAEVDGFREAVAALGLGDRVSLPGWVGRDEVQTLLSGADVLVLPSYGEGMAMSVLEGMSHGRCIVCTPVGALAEVIEHGRSGLLVQPGDVEGLAGALRATLDDPEVRERLGAQANARYRNHYDVLAYPERINAVFDLAEARPGLVSLATPCEEPRA